jgi:serine phosphatase RsbU (regulator of sigma subunit)
MRIAWRTLVVGGIAPDELLPTLQIMHDYERHVSWMFTTLCMATIAPDRRSLSLRLAGHPPPLLITDASVSMLEPAQAAPPLGVVDGARWPAYEHQLPEHWSLLLFTDGLIEGRTGMGGRLGSEGLAAMVRGVDRANPGLVAELVDRAEELNGEPLLDDVAAFLVQRR